MPAVSLRLNVLKIDKSSDFKLEHPKNIPLIETTFFVSKFVKSIDSK